jgi:Zn-dependent membrane protease YugP
MPLILAFGALFLLAVVFGPQLWVRRVLARHGAERPDFPGTGGELARHLLDEAGLADVKVERTDLGDHYDPESRVVRLLPQHFDGRSVAAVAVAAHEVSHAVQHARGDRSFVARLALVKNLVWADRIATGILILAPFTAMLVKSPLIILLHIGAAVALMAIRVVVHLTTLPVEFDASFGKALPALERGRYLEPTDMPAARDVLRAAAWTYVASALATLLNIARWFRLLRF